MGEEKSKTKAATFGNEVGRRKKSERRRKK